jgi:hypothetical protein
VEETSSATMTVRKAAMALMCSRQIVWESEEEKGCVLLFG